MQTGEHWYAMNDPEGKPQGYARLRVDDVEAGAQRFRWELHLGFPGGHYDESRSAVFDAHGQMREATYEDAESAVSVRLEDGRYVGTRTTPEGETLLDVPAPTGAIAGMGFVLVTTLPLENGFSVTHADFNEAQGMKPEGEARFVVHGAEALELPEGTVDAWRAGLIRADGRELPLWVDTAGRLLQADWGGGNLMVLHPASTEALFRPG